MPAVVDLVSKPEDRQLLELMVGPGAMARPFAAPPGLPANKATLLRRAFDATMQDPEFRAEAARIKADLAPTTGEDVQELVKRIYATPRPVIDRVKKLLGAVARARARRVFICRPKHGQDADDRPPRPGRDPRLGWRAACS